MKFIVSKTSCWDSKPCEEAFEEDYIQIDVRSTDDPRKILCYKNNPEKANNEWYGSGSNHRVENGLIMRDFVNKTWFINIETLEDLLNFKEKYGSLVIEPYYGNQKYTKIEIYDDYRE